MGAYLKQFQFPYNSKFTLTSQSTGDKHRRCKEGWLYLDGLSLSRKMVCPYIIIQTLDVYLGGYIWWMSWHHHKLETCPDMTIAVESLEYNG